ncbi:hypothetical protein [Bacillus mycoides]|uniref:hypothetical protein n=1 Tax=Bacillus mycoides TaxID=1405 RepID=UPI0002799B3B|nr:hypothetical protein [Bacillus mycoides]EJS03420.1 hypothetical protein IKM_02593 [Bacillus mycoides]
MKTNTKEIAETITESIDLIETKAQRDELAERIDILEKVKALVLLPNIGMLTARQIADYYEVPLNTIQKIYSRHRKEIQSDGYTSMTGKNLVMDTLSASNYETKKGHYLVDLGSGSSVKLSVSTNGLYSARAVLRFGMLLHGSKVAEQVRTQLLNIRDNADDHMRTKAIDAELLELREKAAKYDALVGDMSAEVIGSYETIIKYEKEKRAAAEKEAVQLSDKVTKFIEDDNTLTHTDFASYHLHGVTEAQLSRALQIIGVFGTRKKPIGEYKEKEWYKIVQKRGYDGIYRPQQVVTQKGVVEIVELIDAYEAKHGGNVLW